MRLFRFPLPYTACIAILVATTGQVQATLTLTFDDVPGGSIQDSYGDMPTYQGFDFSSTLDWIDVEGSGWPYGAHSGDFAILNVSGSTGVVLDAGGADFTFDGLWAKQWGTPKNSGGADSLFGSLSGLNNGQQVWAVDTSLNGSYEYYGPQAGAIDELRLSFGNYFLVDEITLNAPVPKPINLDIKPGPSNNTVALNGNGTLQMAILANADFNVADVDIDSLLFGDPILVDGGATPLGATSNKLRDLNHDGLDDLLVGFSISDLVDGGALDASSVEGQLTGELFDGTPIFGSDIVRMVPQNNGGGGSLAIATVPEPGSCVLALAALCLAMSRRRIAAR